MAEQSWLRARFSETVSGLAFLTRLPVGGHSMMAEDELSRALWSAPVAGAVVGLIGALVYGFATALHLPPLLAATVAVAATVVVTGGLHEDGLADVADGFGGGASRERKLEIMRDSRIGTYGVCTLILSFVLRIGAIANLGNVELVAWSLIASHAAARAPIAAFMRAVPPARSDGLSAGIGRPPQEAAWIAIGFGLLALLLALGFSVGLTAAGLLAIASAFAAWLCIRQIGGQTGDVLGALEQVGEILVLLVATAAADMVH